MSIGLYPNYSWSKASNEELKIGIAQEFENANPLLASMQATHFLSALVARPLVFLDSQGKWQPHLVLKIPTIENGDARLTGNDSKGMEVDWEFHPKAVWGDGRPITGEDFKFTWLVANNPQISVGEKEPWSNIKEVRINKENPKKFTIVYSKAKWDFNHIRYDVLPKHLENAPFKKYGKEKEGYSKNSNYTKNPTLPGLYNGPYVISEMKLGSHITFTPNPKFWGKTPSIQRIIVKLIPNTNTLESNLRSGTIDMISVVGLQFDQALSFDKKAKAENLEFNVNFKPSLVYEHIDLNLSNPLLSDKRVRQALVYAIDRNELTQALFEGRQAPALHNLAPMDPWYTADPTKIVIYNHSARKARALLEDAGWKVGKDNYRYKDGKKLSIQLMTTSGNKTRELVQSYLQDMWKKVGVEVYIKNEPPRVYFGETVRKGTYSGMALFAWISAPENSPRPQVHSENIPSSKNGFSGQNSGKWKNAEVDRLTDQLEGEFDSTKRLAIVHEILKHYTEEVPTIPLFYRSDISVTPKNLVGYELPGHLYASTNSVEEWSVRESSKGLR
jgi:peptide/nickel transport system substrate-binding protein